jgi:septal ring-binding cell division protein DamX/nucleoid DNA-binding protein
MNREDLLKKSVDRGVADETSIGTVSHLFYVYLLSALQRGQRVEIPNFGTFGTRVVGVKRARKMPYFEPEKELADKVNDRYTELKYLVLGKYELIPALGEEEYGGKEAPHDSIVDHIGKEILVDTHRDVTIEEYERSLAASKSVKTTEEKPLMPKLNLKDEGMEPETTPMEDEQPTAPPPTLRTAATGGSGPSPLMQVLIAVVVLGALTFALNYFDVIHLWGKKAPAVVEALPEAEISTQVPETPKAATITPVTPTPMPVPPSKVETPNLGVPASSAGGKYTVQVSSWMTPSKANEEVNRLSTAGFDAFVEDGNVSGEKWYRVRVGRYATEKEAAAAASQLQQMLENGIWVARVGS